MSAQLDLFQIADKNEQTSRIATNSKTVSDLVIGDVVHVLWSNGVQFDGIFTGLRGFWDHRPEYRNSPWVYRYNIQHEGDREPRPGFRDYCQFNPISDEWYWVGHDDQYQLPDTSQILSRLIERLRNVPFSQRLAEYSSFQHEYPYLSYDYNVPDRLLSDAWKTAMMQVSTLDEVLGAFKEWTCKARVSKKVSQHLRQVIFPMLPECRLSAMCQIRWREKGWQNGKDTYWWIHRFPENPRTVYDDLLAHMIEHARTPDELVKLAVMWGEDCRSTTKTMPDFWLESVSESS